MLDGEALSALRTSRKAMFNQPGYSGSSIVTTGAALEVSPPSFAVMITHVSRSQ
jgi:hypothetical protein